MHAPGELRGGLLDAYTATRRFLIRGRRQPDVIFGTRLTPVIFVVLFGYVFGSSIVIPGGNYRSYLMPGLFAMSLLFCAANVSVAVATDMSEGVVDRFRTLPIARSALIIGRSLSTLLLGIPVLVVMIACGLAVGWHPVDGLGNAVLAYLLFELFGFAIGWLGMLVSFSDGIGLPPAARWDAQLGEYLLDWEDVIASPDPHGAALAFGRSVIAHACAVCHWDSGLAASAQGVPPPLS